MGWFISMAVYGAVCVFVGWVMGKVDKADARRKAFFDGWRYRDSGRSIPLLYRVPDAGGNPENPRNRSGGGQ